jgi:hypothetical protein
MNGTDAFRYRQHVLRGFRNKDHGRQGADFESEPATVDVSTLVPILFIYYNQNLCVYSGSISYFIYSRVAIRSSVA